jgi:hypothetical protein
MDIGSAGMGSTSSGTHHDSRKGPMDIGSTGGHYGAGSDNYGSSNVGGYGSTNTGSHGSSTINAGPHDSKIANKMDPRVDSDLGKLNHFGIETPF